MKLNVYKLSLLLNIGYKNSYEQMGDRSISFHLMAGLNHNLLLLFLFKVPPVSFFLKRTPEFASKNPLEQDDDFLALRPNVEPCLQKYIVCFYTNNSRGSRK